jgi:hypothetical protein
MNPTRLKGRLRLVTLSALVFISLTLPLQTRTAADPLIPPITGIIWQPHNHNLDPRGNWHQLGAYQLLVQWTKVDGRTFLPCPGSAVSCSLNDIRGDSAQTVSSTAPSADEVRQANIPAPIPDWGRIGREPWAREVIMGLVGHFQESDARKNAVELAEDGAISAIAPPGVNVVGWYFPVEFDPTWDVPPDVIAALARLPRPLWVSVYDSANVGPEQLMLHLKRWLPPDVGVFWQDGVGVRARESHISLQYIQTMIEHLGPHRVRVIAEVFRPNTGGGFRSATVTEVVEQLAVYKGLPIYLFEGPTYLTPDLLSALVSPPNARQPPKHQGLAE